MSRTLKFYGASDDLFEIEGTKGDEPDEVGSYNSAPVVSIRSNEGEMLVIGQYSVGGTACWMVGVAPFEEDVPTPSGRDRKSVV